VGNIQSKRFYLEQSFDKISAFQFLNFQHHLHSM